MADRQQDDSRMSWKLVLEQVQYSTGLGWTGQQNTLQHQLQYSTVQHSTLRALDTGFSVDNGH